MKRERFIPSLDLINTLFYYDKSNGILKYKNIKQQWRKNNPVGYLHRGYLVTEIKYTHYFVHRLIWFIENKTWPKMIDHINGIKHDNRIENLRECDSRINQQNRKTHRAGKLVGAYFIKRDNVWQSRAKIGKKRIVFGLYNTATEAHNRYKKELIERGLM